MTDDPTTVGARLRAIRTRQRLNPEGPAEFGPLGLRTFLLRGAESHDHSAPRRGATPKTTSQYDGTKDDSSEELNQPDFSP